MDNIPGLVAANKDFVFAPTKVSCPAVVLVGAGEYFSEEEQRQQKEAMDKLDSPVEKGDTH